MDKNEYNMNQLRQALQEIEAKKQAATEETDEVTKRKRVARLIVLLIQIEKELNTVKDTLLKLKEHTLKYNPTNPILPQIEEKLETVGNLTLKIQSSRLNINYYFI